MRLSDVLQSDILIVSCNSIITYSDPLAIVSILNLQSSIVQSLCYYEDLQWFMFACPCVSVNKVDAGM